MILALSSNILAHVYLSLNPEAYVFTKISLKE
ncbi:Uncharacterised protein [Staphylococcus intermedius NCTC 11048]|uniref:Uncharacterized protein n=1 Tax=Staphylococcus intermedius NCTC 11048 TaxID=1141106 RepID=A0A380G483_STAIN|nr:Uncharacterised protein [Staphylococcus intermedius NCTC 11048]